jgi:hypothetical protein
MGYTFCKDDLMAYSLCVLILFDVNCTYAGGAYFEDRLCLACSNIILGLATKGFTSAAAKQTDYSLCKPFDGCLIKL